MPKRQPKPADPHTLEIEDGGPHKSTAIKAPPGEITVLVGPNGSGKTQALRAIDSVYGRDRMTNRDGSTSGRVRWGGVTLRIGRSGSNTRSGELAVESLEDDISLSQLVDPGFKDPAASDARRIQALVVLAGAEADINRFRDAAGDPESFDAVVDLEAREAGDIVQMASRVKRCHEREARRIEKEAEKASEDETAARGACEGIDLDAPHDADELDEAVDAARCEYLRLQAQQASAEEDAERYDAAQQRLASLEHEHAEKPSVAQAAARLRNADKKAIETGDEVSRLLKALADAKDAHDQAKHEQEAASAALEAAGDREELMDSLRETIEEGKPEGPTDDEVSAAQQALEIAKQAADYGVLVRRALEKKREADRLANQADELDRRAQSLRDAGRGVEQVLSSIVGELGTPLKVDRELRLVSEHPTRGECYFDELSMGEKVLAALSILLDHAEGDGIGCLSQEQWESLDYANRCKVHERIHGTNVALMAAEAQQWNVCPRDGCGYPNPMTAPACKACDVLLPPPSLHVEYFRPEGGGV